VTPDSLLPWALSVALLTVRLTVALALSPAFSAYGIPATVRMVLVFSLAALTFAYRPPAASAAAAALDPTTLLPAVLAEILIGALLGLGVHVVLAAFGLAGRLMDVQIGFGLGSVFDPVTRTVSNVLSTATTLLGVTLFVVSDAHLQLAELISQSIDALPLGMMPTFDDPMQPLFAAGEMFALGLALAAPVVAALLLTDVVIAVASRNMPQVNVLILAMPVKVIVGYAVLAISIAGWLPLVLQAFSRLTRFAGGA
jgi:flagellar biosynthesis protein FliR